MLNYIQLQDDLKNLSDDQVRQVAMNPANPMNGTLAVAEIDRRNRVRNDFQARQANPMSTVADQLVFGVPQTPPQMPGTGAPQGPQGGMPAGPSPMGQAPVGAPMASGGAVDNLRGLAGLMRQEELETLPGAFEQARSLLGDDPNVALRAMIERYRGGAGDRRRMDITQLLARIGSGLMNSRRPDYLGALGEGAAGGVEGLDALAERRNAEERQDITDEGALARLATDRQGQQLQTGLGLYSAGRQGLSSAAEIESGILNRDTQMDVARLYASSRGGSGGGSGRFAGLDRRTLNSLFNRASVNLNSSLARLQRMREMYGSDDSPNVQAAALDVQRWEREYNEVREAMVGVTDIPEGEVSADGGVGSGIGALAGDIGSVAAPETNAPAIRRDASPSRGAENEIIERAMRQRGVEDRAARGSLEEQAARYGENWRTRTPDANEYDGWSVRRE